MRKVGRGQIWSLGLRRAPQVSCRRGVLLGAVAVRLVGRLVGSLVEREQSLGHGRGGREQRRRPSPLSSAESSRPPATDVRDGRREQGSQGRAGAQRCPFLGEQWGRPGKLRLVAWWVPPPQPMTCAVTAGVSRYGASKNRRAFQSTSQWARGDFVGQIQYSHFTQRTQVPMYRRMVVFCPACHSAGSVGGGSNELWYLVILDSH